MKQSFHVIIIFALGLTLSGCASVYFSPDAYTIAHRDQHIAVVPPTVAIAARKKVDAEAIMEQQKTESINFQKEMYRWLLKRKMQNALMVEIQDVETTNARLNKSDAYLEGTLEPAEICALLDVDAIMTSNYSLSKPMSEGGAIALGVLVGVWGNTNETVATIELHDRESRKLFWSFHHKVSGSVGSSPGQLVDYLMRKASKKMPYSVPR